MPNPTASDFNPRFHEQIAAQLYGKEPVNPCVAKPRIRQNSKGINKLEASFLLYLQNNRPGARIRYNAVSFELANNLRYKPDFILGFHTAFECKGPWASRDAIPRLKMAARLYPEIKWFLVTKAKRGGFSLEEVLA